MVEHPIREHRYHDVQQDLSPVEIARFIQEINESGKYDLGQYGHILIKDTQVVVGHIGDSSVYLVDSYDKSFHPHHNSLIDILLESLL